MRAIFALAIVCAIATPAAAMQPTVCDNNGRCLVAAAAAPAPGARHHRRAHTAAAEPRLGAGLKSLIATINYKLARYVHPTGKCGSSDELLATYYWQGKRTATGEHFNPDGLTAASRTLAFNTRLHITNPHNGRAVVVRINDRGPYTNAKLDLARGSARALGLATSSYVCVRSL